MKRIILCLAPALMGAVGLSVAAQTPPASAPVAPAVVAAGDEDAGHDVFMSECRICHLGGIAPSLKGVVGRHVAAEPSFTGYTEALKAKGGQVWTEAALDAFLASPSDFAPGTRMMKTVPDAKTRADIIAYLKSLSAPE